MSLRKRCAALAVAGLTLPGCSNPMLTPHSRPPKITQEADDQSQQYALDRFWKAFFAERQQPAEVTAAPANRSKRIALARQLEQAGDNPAQAEILYKAALRNDPEDGTVHHRLGVLLAKRGDVHAAEEHLLAAVRHHPLSVEAANDLGYCYFLQGRHDQAEAALRRALELDPGHAIAANNLARVLGDRAEGKSAGAQAAAVAAPQPVPAVEAEKPLVAKVKTSSSPESKIAITTAPLGAAPAVDDTLPGPASLVVVLPEPAGSNASAAEVPAAKAPEIKAEPVESHADETIADAGAAPSTLPQAVENAITSRSAPVIQHVTTSPGDGLFVEVPMPDASSEESSAPEASFATDDKTAAASDILVETQAPPIAVESEDSTVVHFLEQDHSPTACDSPACIEAPAVIQNTPSPVSERVTEPLTVREAEEDFEQIVIALPSTNPQPEMSTLEQESAEEWVRYTPPEIVSQQAPTAPAQRRTLFGSMRFGDKLQEAHGASTSSARPNAPDEPTPPQPVKRRSLLSSIKALNPFDR